MKSQIDFRNPIDWQHPDTAGLQFALLNIPGLTGGSRWPDASQRTNGGTLANGPTWGADGLSFDGVDDIVTISDFPAHPSTGYTFACSLRRETNSGIRNACGGFSRGMGLIHVNAGNLRWQTPTDIISSVPMTLGKWHRFLCTQDGVTATMYQDGVPVASLSRTVPVGTVNVGLGYDPNAAGRFWLGGVSDYIYLSRPVDAAYAARDYERFLRPAHENPTFRKLRNWAFWDLGAAGPGTVSADAAIVQAVGSLLASAAVLIGAASAPEQSQTAAGSASITVGANAATTQSQQAEASASITVGAAADLEQSQSLAGTASIIVGAGVEISQGGTLTATASSGESVDTGAGFPWLVAGLGYW